MRILVVGYGNPLRKDDAVGLWVARRLSQEGVESIPAWPLTPELITRIAAADLVIFVDADARSGPIRWRKVRPKSTTAALSHGASPGELLAWARVLFGWAPEAWLVTIPGEDFSFGEGLSQHTKRRAERLVRRIRKMFAEG